MKTDIKPLTLDDISNLDKAFGLSSFFDYTKGFEMPEPTRTLANLPSAHPFQHTNFLYQEVISSLDNLDHINQKFLQNKTISSFLDEVQQKAKSKHCHNITELFAKESNDPIVREMLEEFKILNTDSKLKDDIQDFKNNYEELKSVVSDFNNSFKNNLNHLDAKDKNLDDVVNLHKQDLTNIQDKTVNILQKSIVLDVRTSNSLYDNDFKKSIDKEIGSLSQKSKEPTNQKESSVTNTFEM